MAFRYVPLLRTKAGEAGAIQNLTPAAAARLLPLFHVSEKPAATFISKLSMCWVGRTLALDGLYNMDLSGSAADFLLIFRSLGSAGVRVVPAIECDAPASYLSTVGPLVNQFAPGLVVKATLAQLSTVAAWVAARGWPKNDIDLIVNAAQVAAYGDADQFASYVSHQIAKSVPSISPWRSVTLASSAAPRDYSTYSIGRNVVKRLDWLLWNQIAPQMPFTLDYGDYGVAHPDLTEPPGVAMVNASVSVRYTTDQEWLILKGRSTRGPSGRPIAQQFHGHAVTLVADPQFGGVAGCWADSRIRHIASGASGPGARATWVEINTNRHLSLVADRLP